MKITLQQIQKKAAASFEKYIAAIEKEGVEIDQEDKKTAGIFYAQGYAACVADFAKERASKKTGA